MNVVSTPNTTQTGEWNGVVSHRVRPFISGTRASGD
jgi:hypothetical protein